MEESFTETALGDFSDDPAAPTDLGTLEIGTVTIEATQEGDPREIDYLTFVVPEGAELTEITLADFVAASGNLAFLGIEAGGQVTTDPFAPSAETLLGGITYGATQIGQGLLDDIGALNGAIGFDGPLGPGAYAIWLNQTGPASTVTLDLTISSAGGDDTGTDGDDSFAPAALVDGTVFDGGADSNTTGAGADLATGDTLDLSGVTGLSEGVSVDLDAAFGGAPNPGLAEEGFVQNFATVSGGEQTFEVTLVDIENVIGTEFDDRLFGNAEDNVLAAGGGDDIIHAFGGVDIYDGGEGVDIALFNQAGGGVTADLAAGTAGPNTLISIENFSGGVFDDDISGDDGVNLLLGNDGNDRIESRLGADTLSGGGGSDSFAFTGDPFQGVDVSAPGRDIVGGEDIIEDFAFDADQYLIDAAGFGLQGDVSFVAIDANDPDAVIPDDANVIVLLNADNDGDAETPFLAGTAATQIAGLTDAARPGLFVYFNSNLDLNRLAYSTDLSSAEADLQILSRQTDLTGQDAVDALASFSADNFAFENLDGGAIVGTPGDDSFSVEDLGAPQTIDGLGGSDTVEIASAIAGAEIAAIEGGFAVTPAGGAALTLLSVERIVFEDATLEADFGDLAANALRLFEVATDATPDIGAVSGVVDLVEDGGLSFVEAATAVAATAGLLDPTLSDGDFVDGLYLAGLEREADAGGREFWLNGLGEGAFERGDVVAAFAGSEEAQVLYAEQTDDGVLLLA